MPRDLRAHENRKRAKARRDGALARSEFRTPSSLRQSADGPTSMPVKVVDPATTRLVEEFLQRDRGDK